MSSKLPPIPQDNRSPKGIGGSQQVQAEDQIHGQAIDPDKKGQQGNTKVNTTHQGYQQDR